MEKFSRCCSSVQRHGRRVIRLRIRLADGKRMSLGVYDTRAKARAAYDEALRQIASGRPPSCKQDVKVMLFWDNQRPQQKISQHLEDYEGSSNSSTNSRSGARD
jgi:hypothetical protein